MHFAACQGLEVVPVEESSNQQYPDPPSPQPSVSGFNALRLSSDGCSNQQVSDFSDSFSFYFLLILMDIMLT